jgi:hypothetical protein
MDHARVRNALHIIRVEREASPRWQSQASNVCFPPFCDIEQLASAQRPKGNPFERSSTSFETTDPERAGIAQKGFQNSCIMKRPKRKSAVRAKDAGEAAEIARRYVRDLFGGEEPNHQLITTTLFLAAFESAKKIPDVERRRAVLQRAYERAYEDAGQ